MTTPTPPPSRRPGPVRILRLLGRLGVVTLILVSLAWIVPSLLGYERYVITGGSMSGSIERGSVAFEKPAPVPDLSVGDVITYLPPRGSGVDDLVTHRIVEIETAEDGGPLFRTQGDANADPDPWQFTLTAPNQPVVEFSVPLVGYVFTSLADPGARILVIGVPAALIALLAAVELVRTVRHTDPVDPPAEPTTAG